MTSILLEDKSIENFEKALTSLQESAEAIIILACDENQFSKALLDPILKISKLPIIGGIFPSIIYKNRQYTQGTIFLGLDNPFEVTTIENISQDKDYDTVIKNEIGTIDENINTMFLFFDGISDNVDTIIQALFSNYGLTINYIGASAAHASLQKKPILFSKEGLLEDVALLATSSSQSTVGVKHGWEPIDKTTYQITKSHGNIIDEIDYQPAFKVYKNIIETHTGKTFNEKDFLSLSIIYPIGINRLSGDRIVRTATETVDGYSLTCTGDTVENSYFQVLHAENEQLIHAAKVASQLSHNQHYQSSFKLYIGCLARLIVLEEEFYKEIEAIYEEDELLIGAISIGEIANNKDHYLELYNATAVVAKIADV